MATRVESYRVLKNYLFPLIFLRRHLFFSIHFICVIHFICICLYSCEEEQEDILFYFISFEVIKIKNVLKLRILLYFSSNKRSIPLVSPPGYRPTRIYAHQKRPFSGYTPWAYIHYFTVLYLPFLTYLPGGIFV